MRFGTDLVLSVGCAVLVSAGLILTIPRLGTIVVEMLVGMLFIGWGLVARVRANRSSGRSTLAAGAPWGSFGRYEALLFVSAIVVAVCAAGTLRRIGWSEGSIAILALVLFAAGILLKRRCAWLVGKVRRNKEVEETWR